MEWFRACITYTFKDGSRIKWIFKPTYTLSKATADKEIMLLTYRGQIIGKPLINHDYIIMRTGQDEDLVINKKDIIGWINSPVEFLKRRFKNK